MFPFCSARAMVTVSFKISIRFRTSVRVRFMLRFRVMFRSRVRPTTKDIAIVSSRFIARVWIRLGLVLG